jgi:cell division septal protein FtsQ
MSMRRELRVLLATVLFGAAWTWGGQLPRALEDVEAFRVKNVEVHGLRFLSRADVLEAMGITSQSSVWGDVDAWVEAVTDMPMVRFAKVERRVPDGLVVFVTERRPVALVPTPTIEPVDMDGVLLPLDPAKHRLDLPLVEADPPPAEGSLLLPKRIRLLVGEVDRLMSVDTAFLQMVSEVRWGEGHTLVARWAQPDVEFLLPFGLSPERLQEGLEALGHAMSRPESEVPEIVDLRFADLVVVR